MKNSGQLWKIWLLGTFVVIAALILLLLCIVTKPVSVKSADELPAQAEREIAAEKNAPIVLAAEDAMENASEIPAPAQILPSSESDNAESVSVPVIEEKKIAPKAHKFDIPDAQNNAILVFIFDDAGQSISKLQRYTALPFAFTVAVLPHLPHSADCASELKRKGKEIMLHQPMQAVNLSINPGPGAITPDMDSFAIEELLNRNIDSLGVKIAGMNNHEGSLITSDLVKMLAVLKVVQEKGIYFVDSRTTAATKVPQAGQLLGTKVFSNDVFLDNEVERGAILSQIYKGISVANKNGRAVMIGHIDKSVDVIPKLLSEMYPELTEKGYSFGTLSAAK